MKALATKDKKIQSFIGHLALGCKQYQVQSWSVRCKYHQPKGASFRAADPIVWGGLAKGQLFGQSVVALNSRQRRACNSEH
jgi:hypothetical protein